MEQPQGETRVRFAPSPTGYLHLGSARTALYNFLFARHKKGKFILRVEDTDKLRSKKEYLEEILQDLQWLGLVWDEGPFFQSERKDVYDGFASRLLDEGKAYKDDGAVRFKMPSEQIVVYDLIHGKVEFDGALLEDMVIVKSDGMPAYNFACVADDIQMEISHIIRGDDHLSNTPKQIAVYQALGYAVPVFAHIPLILGSDRSPLSKRHGAASINEYRCKGYLAEALVNYLTLLGWSPGSGSELMALDTIIEKFNIKKVNKTAAIFDMDKLNWANGEYIRGLSPKRLSELIVPVLERAGFLDNIINKIKDKEWLVRFCGLFQKRLKTLDGIIEAGKYFFVDEIDYEPEVKEQYLSDEKNIKLLEKWADALERLEDFKSQAIETSCRELAVRMGIKAGEIIHPARVALTGRTASPGLFELMELLGRDTVLMRLNNVKDIG